MDHLNTLGSPMYDEEATLHPHIHVDTTGMTWVSPNACLDHLDYSAISRWTGPRAETPRKTFDSMQYPDWYCQEKHWHPWIPQVFPGLWWHPVNGDTSVPLRDNEEARKDLLAMKQIMRIIDRHLRPEGPKPENPYRLEDLDLSLPESRDQARRFLLSTCGYIRWLQAHRHDEVVRCLDAANLDRLCSWGLYQPGGIGVILDLVRDKREMNVWLYIQHDVPVYYPWTTAAATDATLYGLSPEFLLSQTHYLATYASSSRQDFVFQPELSPQLGSTITSQHLSPVTHKAVDFYGWLPRSLSRRAAKCCFQSFYFQEHISDTNLVQSQPQHLRIYYRCRLNAPATSPRVYPDSVDVYIRETWKFQCAPPPGQIYDPVTSQLQNGVPSVMCSTPVLLLSSSFPSQIQGKSEMTGACDDPVSDLNMLMEDVTIHVDWPGPTELEVQTHTFVLRLPHLHMPSDDGAWLTHTHRPR
ncbi:hypothetical protein M405DRAFT_866276 [Rhizopogon salebrosus TDB-379]|nr:hypothetical protein M405DRAFT_866276 [Rhizopogon salebrosus TDB-379]